MQNTVNVTSNFFEKHELVLGADEIIVISCMRNEGERLPYFLDYYRRLGVTRFLLIDNNSTDDTEEFLRAQPDVEYFTTTSSYRGSCAGRLWMQELADTYATDRWVITVDVDELLTYPGAELLGLRDLCAYLEKNGHQGLFTILLDMYSDLPLAQTVYKKGTDFLDTCPFFETDTYTLAPGANPPFLGVFGGPRGRLFEASGEPGPGPMMKKIPLVKWTQGFSYIYSTHSHRFVQLSDVSGALLHFKFFSTFEETATRDAARGDRRQQADYGTYQGAVGRDLCFYGHQSHRYRSPRDLVQLGVMRSSPQYATFCAGTLQNRGMDMEAAPGLLPEPAAPEGRLTLRSVAALWPFVQNPALGRYFGRVELSPRHRTQLIYEMRRHIRIVDLQPDHLVVRIKEPALHRWLRSALGLSVYVGERLVRNVLVDGSDDEMVVDVDSLEPNVYRVSADLAGAAAEAEGGNSLPVSIYLFDGMEEDRLVTPPGATEADARPVDPLIFSSKWFPGGASASRDIGFDGVIETLREGQLRGWAFDVERNTFDIPVCVYVNGHLVSYAVPSNRRSDLDRLPGSARGRGFQTRLPLGYFTDKEPTELTVETFVAGTNIRLRRSPLVLPHRMTSASWDRADESWVVTGPQGQLDLVPS